MKNMSAGEAILNNPNNVTVMCKTCKAVLKGGEAIINHLDVHGE